MVHFFFIWDAPKEELNDVFLGNERPIRSVECKLESLFHLVILIKPVDGLCNQRHESCECLSDKQIRCR